jgi:formamidopyrimidine-DNA glycosylase
VVAGTIRRVPELPDLAILADVFAAALEGRPATALRIVDPLVLRATPGQAASLVGQVLQGVGRRGKHLVFRFERNDIWAAPMLSGRFGLAAPGAARPKAAIAIRFGPGPVSPRAPAAWVAGAAWLADASADVELRYLDPTRMGKIYLAPAADPSSVPGIAELGPDADDPTLTLEAWQARIRRHPGELKALLRNQAFVAGIGNAYSDEILWEARLSPFRRRSTLASEETAALFTATRSTLAEAIVVLRGRVPPTFEKQVRDHLQVHLRGGRPCPRCGTTISQVGGREATSFCRSCQR